MVGSYSRCELFGGKKRTLHSVDAAPGGYVMATVFYGFNRPGDGVMLIMLFKMLQNVMACLIILRRSSCLYLFRVFTGGIISPQTLLSPVVIGQYDIDICLCTTSSTKPATWPSDWNTKRLS